ncbi:phosphonate metabolism protein/1,5-bisphosphokinase (PRPP-forming) PhnN [Opitutales bacterium ASA1]|uniref:phosphonate metabolism protein/1,5-bisphosphokinase (PRPP-forming) PhnN n=1 Tax=Congregicoccus parvus TaxID=3081749 RepID=UPI002B2D9027|nr:phosphonate metabolism protein/1,5-bisphosphokinase (PRPP-forming) PhnN [Opitutales bacterium ASA1]
MSGQLFYVVGPSGAGKDSLLDYARRHLPVDAPVVFAHRYITRPAAAGGENHVAVSPEEFARMLTRGLFALSWESHGHRYGLGVEIDQWLAHGLNVVMNGSRAHLAVADARYGDRLQVVSVEVAPSVLRARLTARGRESAAEIRDRITRASAFTVEHPRVLRLANNGPLSEAGGRLVDALCATVPLGA